MGLLPGPVQRSGGVCDIFPATPSCSQNSCWGLLWQLSTESTWIHLLSTTLLFQFSHSHFSFFHSFCNAVIQASLDWVFLGGGLKKWWKALLFCITLGRFNYSVLWNHHTVSGNRVPGCLHYLLTDIRKTLFDLASSLTTLSCDFWQLYQIIGNAFGRIWDQVETRKQNKTLVFPCFFLVYAIVQYLIWYSG